MRTTIVLGSALAAAAMSPAQAALPPGFAAKADAILAEAYPADGPGASVVVSDHGKIVYQGSRGLADLAAKRPITPQTVFRIGSITKQFSAAVVLQLAAEGKLKLSDPISKYLPDYPGGAGITISELLNHTSGIQSYTGIPGWMVEANTNRAYTTRQLIAVFKDQPPVTKPGEAWAYNNSGYILVGALIEAVTGKPWYQAVEERIVKPLGLTTGYGVDEASIPAMASGYGRDEKGIVPANKIHMSVPAAAGALVGTPTDLARWADALHHGKVVPAPYYAQMIAPTKLPDGTTKPYGFGIEPGVLRGARSIGHSGGIFGFSTDSVYLPAEDLFVAVYTNSDAPQTAPGITMSRLAALAMGKPYPEFKPAPLDAKAVEPFLGTYKFKDMTRVLALADGKLEYRRPDDRTSELVPVGGNRFMFDGALTWIALTRDAAGNRLLKINQNGDADDDLGTWTGPVPVDVELSVPAATLASYVGSYTTPMGKATIAQGDDGKLSIQLAGQPALKLRASSATEFKVDKVGATVRFVAAGGKVTGLEIDQGGRKMPGTRD